ncbi:uncharacterized protein [Phaseolus vulgaris]|uniref:uncharacterized protein n=1 Tax=Phaseolus vulgaris TaxID=3885 RepID=UPI0035CAAF57
MIEAFTEEEIKEAVWQCEGTKSPGPNGFNFNFIKKSWNTLKSDFLAAMECFQETGSIPKGCNASFIALIPKVRDPCNLNQFRPISLVGAIYKVISKVLAGRLKKVLPDLIDGSQSAFLEGRCLTDSVLVANEVIEDIRRRRKRGLCLKVDFEKAYDLVRWDFLYDMLSKMGFHSVWIKWIRACMESATVSVLVNGSPTEEFKPTRGLRQGDPMAPFLFLVVAEGLAGLVRQALKANLLSGVKVGNKEVEMSFLQFVDDTFFLCEDSWSNVVTMKTILRGFEIASVKYQSWWWRDLVKVCKEGGGEGWFQKEVHWVLGRGDKVRFWEDVWIGDTTLKSLFPRLYSLSANKEQKVEDVGMWEGLDWKWRLGWSRDIFEWESKLEEFFSQHLGGADVKQNKDDVRVWGEENLERYSVNAAYKSLLVGCGGTYHATFEYLWKAKAFPDILSTSWRALINRIPTREGLNRRGVQLSSLACVLCEVKEETCQHLFLECIYAQQVWFLCLKWLGITLVQQNDLKDHFLSFHLPQFSFNQNLVLKGIWAAIVRCIWDQRNAIIFKQDVVDVEEILQMAQLKSWLWMKYRTSHNSHSFSDWLLNLLDCLKSIG